MCLSAKKKKKKSKKLRMSVWIMYAIEANGYVKWSSQWVKDLVSHSGWRTDSILIWICGDWFELVLVKLLKNHLVMICVCQDSQIWFFFFFSFNSFFFPFFKIIYIYIYIILFFSSKVAIFLMSIKIIIIILVYFKYASYVIYLTRRPFFTLRWWQGLN